MSSEPSVKNGGELKRLDRFQVIGAVWNVIDDDILVALVCPAVLQLFQLIVNGLVLCIVLPVYGREHQHDNHNHTNQCRCLYVSM